jgi:uncharacterized protein
VDTDEVAADVDTQAGPERLLDPRFIAYQRLMGLGAVLAVSALTFIVLLIVLAVADELEAWARIGLGLGWVGAIVALAWAAHQWPARAYAHMRYELDADGLRMEHGVYWRTATHVPRSRVQHTDVSQGPLERKYGLGTLVVYTAGTSFARVTVPGLAHETAVRLRDSLRTVHSDDAV